MLNALVKSGATPEDEFDVLIIGGGATGAGVAVDAATRGLKAALHERKIFQQTAPYLSNMLPIMRPLYKYFNPSRFVGPAG